MSKASDDEIDDQYDDDDYQVQEDEKAADNKKADDKTAKKVEDENDDDEFVSDFNLPGKLHPTFLIRLIFLLLIKMTTTTSRLRLVAKR